MLNFARNAAVGSHAKVAVFSLEMAGEQLAQRLLAAESRVNSAHLRLGMHNEAEQSRIMHALGVLAGASIWVDDTAMIQIPELRAKLDPPAARARPRPRDPRLPAARPGQPLRQPRAGDQRHHALPQAAGARAQHTDRGRLPALARPGAAPAPHPHAQRPARVRLHRAGRRRGHVHLPRGDVHAPRGVGGPAPGPRERPLPRRARPRSSSPSTATAPPASSRSASGTRSRSSKTSPASRPENLSTDEAPRAGRGLSRSGKEPCMAGAAGAQPMCGGPWGVSPQESLLLLPGAEQRESDAQRAHEDLYSTLP